jgi:hypothetical protein
MDFLCLFQIGAKIVTLPKFEPEEYIQALVTYKVSHNFPKK